MVRQIVTADVVNWDRLGVQREWLQAVGPRLLHLADKQTGGEEVELDLLVVFEKGALVQQKVHVGGDNVHLRPVRSLKSLLQINNLYLWRKRERW